MRDDSQSRLAGLLRWLYPGLEIKRWLGLAVISAIIFGAGLLLVLGRSLVGQLYDLLVGNSQLYYTIASIFLGCGLLGVIWAINKAVRSVFGDILTDRSASAPEVLWRRRFLSRGPSTVAIGGGTGLSVLLRGLKAYTSNISAVVTVMDDGGSSGRLRREMDMLPPGDIRNCIIALADDESQMGKVFQHRFKGGAGLDGHSLGNLFIAGMERMTGSFDKAIEETSRLLNIRGQVIPATLADTNLEVTFDDGHTVVGESSVSKHPGRITGITLSDSVDPHPKAINAIREAEVLVIGPGSLYTSLIPNLLVQDIADEVVRSSAKKFFVVNIMTEPGETDNYSVSDHLVALQPYLPLDTFDKILVNSGEISRELLDQYAEEGARPVYFGGKENPEIKDRVLTEDFVSVVELDDKRTIKHDYRKLAEVIFSHS